MITELEIENFRCFERLKLIGFRQVNLLTGLNNSGKTAVLEALFLGSSPTASTVHQILKLRGKVVPWMTSRHFDFFCPPR